MEELAELIEKSSMTIADWSECVGVRYTSVVRMLTGKIGVPPGLIGDGHQLLADIDYVQSLVDHNPALGEISYKVWKNVLDTTE